MCDVTVTKNVLKLFYLFLLYYLLSNIQILSQKKVYKKLEGNSKKNSLDLFESIWAKMYYCTIRILTGRVINRKHCCLRTPISCGIAPLPPTNCST